MNSDPAIENEIGSSDACEGRVDDAEGAQCHSSSSGIVKGDISNAVTQELCGVENSMERAHDIEESGCSCKTENATSTQLENQTNVSPDGQQQQYSDQDVRQSPNNQVQKLQPNRTGSVQAIKPNYSSATTVILGSVSDRDDFLSRDHSYSRRLEICPAEPDSKNPKSTADSGSIIQGVKKWFSASSSTAADIEEAVEHDYHRHVLDDLQSPPKSRKSFVKSGKVTRRDGKSAIEEQNYDESLLENGSGRDLECGRRHSADLVETDGRLNSKRNADARDDCSQHEEANEGGDGKHKFKYTNDSWRNHVRNKAKNSFGGNNKAADELRVMGECSFFYDGMYNDVEETTTNHSPSRRVQGDENDEDEGENGYFQQGHSHEFHRVRMITPRAMAKVMSSTAKRQWTERRYRRRLKQSAFEPPKSIWNNRWHGQQHSDSGISKTQREPASYELTTEHRQAFLAAHAALNAKLANEYSRNKHAINFAEYGYDLDIDLDLNLSADNQQEEIRADLTKSSLAIRGSGQIRLPVDNVRLVMDSHLQPGILSVESRAGGYMGYENYGNGNRYGDIKTTEVVPLSGASKRTKKRSKKSRRQSSLRSCIDQPLRRNELTYVLTVDDHLYRRLFQEISDSYRLPCGMYYCCHMVESEASHDHVGIGVAVAILLFVFVLLVVGMLIWPMD
eukprot:CCRYP_012665-RB/>CCRYP_012665-RB protein AED:0.02 eAED:0.02 QI:309/1/1/1/0/0.33/3/4146/676